MTTYPNMQVRTRSNGGDTESPYEKTVIVPQEGDMEPTRHAWADARFAVELMSEHAMFLSMLMPEETVGEERQEARRFANEFSETFQRIDSSPPPERGELHSFTDRVIEQMKPLIDFKARMGEAQRTGRLRSLAWPLFYDHIRREAEWYVHRLEILGSGQSEFGRSEIVTNWADLMDEEARFFAHLLDPDEFDLVDKTMKMGTVWRELRADSVGAAGSAMMKEPGTVMQSMTQNPQMDAVMSSALTMLDFETQAVRDIEAARIKSIIDPRLADHNRRETMKFIDELRRAV